MPQVKLIRIHIVAVAALCLISGCSEKKSLPVNFEPNLVHSMKYQLQDDLEMEGASKDAFWVVDTMFGTPDDPLLPQVIIDDEDLASLISPEKLHQASGSEHEEGRGLYRLLCASCHGITGDGRGPLAASQVPYPRDYRKGVFKFKSTERGSKPTKDDLNHLIKSGIEGTNMTSVAKLLELEKLKRGSEAESWIPDTITDEDVDALVDYVIYLSIRGEHERTQIDMGILEGILEGGDRLIDSDLGRQLSWSNRETRKLLEEKIEMLDEKDELSETEDEELEKLERFQEEWEYTEDYAIDIVDAWLAADEEVVAAPSPPETIPVPDSFEELVVMQQSEGEVAEALKASIKRGQEVFVGKVAACSKCHGEKGLGNGQTTDFDDWTNEWTSRIGIKPDNLDKLTPLLARGALKPQNAMPRNFTEGIFRGGAKPQNLYRRIMQGIEGSPMPAATLVEGQFEEDDVWHLINFVRALQKVDLDDNPASETEKVRTASPSVITTKQLANSQKIPR